ncbi:MAG TPA: phosphate signaling complex protein PhoU [Candidatus Binatia bacterium]|nr:phosphate signaling complex protein PhoU [Candidatus Binatia bacterium]
MTETTDQTATQTPPGADPAERLRPIRELVLSMGDEVDRAISEASAGLVGRDVDLCTKVIEEDSRVDGLLVEVRELSLSTLEEGPPETQLREVIGLLHMANELERMADHCVNIARIGRELAERPPLGTYIDIPQLSTACAAQVRDMLAALISRDAQRARAIAARDDRVNRIHHRIVDDLVQLMAEYGDTVYRGVQLVLASQNYERIGDRVTNLAEDLVFLESGNIEDLG